MDFLGLLGGGDFAGADGPGVLLDICRGWLNGRGGNVPDGLIGNDNLRPVLDLVGNGLELRGHDLDGLAGFALLQALAAAQDHAEAAVNSCLGLVGNELDIIVRYHGYDILSCICFRTWSSSWRITLRSEWPRMVQVMPLSFSCWTEISPVKAPFGLSKTFCAATSMPLRRCSRVRRR